MKTAAKYLAQLLTLALLVGITPAAAAADKAGEFKNQPDKAFNSAHEAFLKGETKKAATQIQKAADYVKRQSEHVDESSKAAMKQTAADLEKLGDGVKNGTVKSADDLKKAFAKADHQVATCWHKTAAASRTDDKAVQESLTKAGRSLAGAAKWSGNQLSDGAKSTVKAMKKAGKATGDAAKASADQVDKWFKDIGDGLGKLKL